MSELLGQLGAVSVVVMAFLVGPFTALFFMLRRKRRVRAERRSPIARDLLRGPGHSLNEQLTELNGDVVFDLMLLMVVPLMTLALFLAQGAWRGGIATMWHLAPIYGFGAVGAIFYSVCKLVRSGEKLDRLKAGFDAELAVGQELDQLMRQGAFVFHDVPAENFNIDHVVISTRGVFAVETKGYTKAKDPQGRGPADQTVACDGKSLRFPTWTTSKPLEQAERQAKWLAQWLTSAVGSAIQVQPVLALPGWFVELKGRGSVRVFNGKQLAGLLESRGVKGLAPQDVQRVAHQVEQRCRTVLPRYRDDDKAT